MEMFNGMGIDPNVLYSKNFFVTYIKAFIERYGWSDPGKKEANIIRLLHLNNIK